MAETTHNLNIKTTVKDLASRELRGLGTVGKRAGDSIAAGFVKAQIALGAIRVAIRSTVRAITSMTTQWAEQTDALAKLSRRVGVSVEDLSALGRVAEFSGTSVESVGNAMRFLQKNLYEAGRGMSTAQDAFRSLGFSMDEVSKLAGMDVADAFIEVGDRLSQLGTQAEKTGPAMALLGRSATDIFPMFEEGAESLRASVEQVKALGGVITTQQARVAEAFQDSRKRLEISIMGVKTAVAERLLPVLTDLFDKVSTWIAQNRDELRDFLINMAAGLVEVSAVIAKTLGFIAAVVQQIRGKTDEANEIIRNIDEMTKRLDRVIERIRSAKGAGEGTGLSPDIEAAIQEERLLQDWLRNRGEITVRGERPWIASFLFGAKKIEIDPETKEQITTYIGGIKGAIEEAMSAFAPERLGMTMVEMATNAWVGFFDAIAFGSQRAGDAFRSMASTMLRQMATLANQRLFLELLSLLGAAGGSVDYKKPMSGGLEPGFAARGGTSAPSSGVR